MSICLTRFPISGLGDPNTNIIRFVFQELGILLGGWLRYSELPPAIPNLNTVFAGPS